MRRAALTVLGATVLALVGGAVTGAAPASAGQTRDLFPQVISLPNGWQPEGIATGRGTSFYVGSLRDGAIYRGSVLTGRGSVLVPGEAGRVAVGIEVDRRNLLWVAGGATGTGRVYDAGSGRELASYQFTTGDDLRQRRRRHQGRGLLHRLDQPGALRGAARPPRPARRRRGRCR